MDRDSALALKVGVTLVVLLAAALAVWNYREEGRPVLREVRVVAAGEGSGSFRDGTLALEADEGFELAVALRLQERDGEPYWISPVPELVLGGEVVDHARVEVWPESDRTVRVHWFTIESSLLGGEITENNAQELLEYRTFLAPDLGRSLRVRGDLEPRNDDYTAADPAVRSLGCGTLRFYARVEVVSAMSDVRSLQAVSSLGPDRLWDRGLPVVRRRLPTIAGLDPAAGELFLLPGLAPRGDQPTATTADLEVSGRSLRQWIEARLAATSWSFASTALTGGLDLEPASLRPLGTIRVLPGRLIRNGRPLRWDAEVRPGDLLASGAHWVVVVADDGDGYLDLNDLVAHCWRKPPRVVSLLAALDTGVQELRHLRHEP